jgi:hypothetical protein
MNTEQSIKDKRVAFQNQYDDYTRLSMRGSCTSCAATIPFVELMNEIFLDVSDDLGNRINILEQEVHSMKVSKFSDEKRQLSDNCIEQYRNACADIIGLLYDDVWKIVRTTYTRADNMNKTAFFDYVDDNDQDCLNRRNSALSWLGLTPKEYEDIVVSAKDVQTTTST